MNLMRSACLYIVNAMKWDGPYAPPLERLCADAKLKRQWSLSITRYSVGRICAFDALLFI